MSANFNIGDKVFITLDPDNDVFQGCCGVIEKINVKCADGIGVIVNLNEWGPVRATYEMLGRMQ